MGHVGDSCDYRMSNDLSKTDYSLGNQQVFTFGNVLHRFTLFSQVFSNWLAESFTNLSRYSHCDCIVLFQGERDADQSRGAKCHPRWRQDPGDQWTSSWDINGGGGEQINVI